MFKLNLLIIPLLFIIIVQIKLSHSHGRLIEPPSRSSAWRFGFQTPHNYNDHELYCGGYARQWNRNGGKCGECGDAWDVPKPRPNEFGGKYGLGVTVRRYKPEQTFEIKVDLTANHNGFFEFRLCPFITATQECLDSNQIQIFSKDDPKHRSKFYPDRALGPIFTLYGVLPKNFSCHRCVFQWRYVAGNNWGTCENGTGAVGCGPQEEFRACADISILDSNIVQTFEPPVDINPTSSSTIKPTVRTTDTISTEVAIERFVYSGIFIALFSLISVICLFALAYICYYEDHRIKKILEKRSTFGRK